MDDGEGGSTGGDGGDRGGSGGKDGGDGERGRTRGSDGGGDEVGGDGGIGLDVWVPVMGGSGSTFQLLTSAESGEESEVDTSSLNLGGLKETGLLVEGKTGASFLGGTFHGVPLSP